jgi:exodeoxyribonuclease VII large subunit
MALSALLNAVSPLAVLGRGYAVVRKGDPDASVVRSWDQVTEGERLSVLLHQGGLDCEVLSRSAADRVDKADG